MSSEAAPEIYRGELDAPSPLGGEHLRRRLLVFAGVIVLVAAVVTLAPGLGSLRSQFAHARPGWLVLGGVLKVLSGLAYVAVFREVFCRRMNWRLSTEIGLSELGANAVLPTGGAGGLALGAWALRRGGMATDRIARRSVAFFFLTSVPNVLGVIFIGLGLALGWFAGRESLALTLGPALVAAASIVLALLSGRLAAAARQRLIARHGVEARLPRVLGAIADGVSETLALLREHDPLLILGLIGYLGFDVMILWATFHAFGSAEPALAIIWMGYLIGELGGLIPVPGGIGGVDLGLVGTLTLYHVPLSAATAAVLGYRAIALWIPAVLGSIAFVFLRRSLAREELTLSGCQEGEEVEVIGRGRVRVRSL
jgi:uncharacterized membrane protein YbhN (UPF0104 family)